MHTILSCPTTLKTTPTTPPQAQARYGNNWKAISMLLPGRTNRAVKNLFVGNLKWGARLTEVRNRCVQLPVVARCKRGCWHNCLLHTLPCLHLCTLMTKPNTAHTHGNTAHTRSVGFWSGA
jgi:hypothetical protein